MYKRQVLIAGPQVVKRALGKDLSKEQLGGPEVHLKSGVINNLAEDEEDAFNQIRTFLSFMPDNAWQRPKRIVCSDPANRRDEELASIVPKNSRQPFQMRKIIQHVIDLEKEETTFFEIGQKFGPSLITGLGRMH